MILVCVCVCVCVERKLFEKKIYAPKHVYFCKKQKLTSFHPTNVLNPPIYLFISAWKIAKQVSSNCWLL